VAILGVDVGGTFTDAVLLDGGELVTAKVPTAARQEESVLAAARAVGAGRVERFSHGTTIATNALLERKGARTAFVATAGFEHLLHLRRQTRPHLYRLCEQHAEPLVPLEQCFGVEERIGPEGVLRELELSSVPQLEAEAVAVCFLFSFREPAHERAVADELRRRLPDAHVVASSDVAPEFREYERASTTAVDAYLGPLTGGYLQALGQRCVEAGLPEPLVMRSSGGVATIDEAAEHAALILVSGPAAGAVGAARIAALAGVENAISFDMGGTSTDVCLIAGGRVERSAAREVAGFPIRLPSVDIHTVGAGGGSLAWRDAGGAIRVGPESAGAEPGPACYGRGGTEPTVTDANLVLGHLDPGEPLAGGVELDADAAREAVGTLADELGLSVEDCAAGIVRVANAEMVRAMRVMTVERGVDPRDFALLAFGGAGPLHAAAIAEELGMRKILVPRASGVLSALGLAAADRRRDHARTVFLHGEDLTDEALAVEDGDAAYDVRYRGQSFELTVRDVEADPKAVREAFEAVHEERYGYKDPEGEIEVVTIRERHSEPGPDVEFEGDKGEDVEGPTVVRLPEATLVVPEGWRGSTDRTGTIVLTREESS
jgi:N-methylhydantoinase A/oxoprolinase/acetone carboxylase beta subunit